MRAAWVCIVRRGCRTFIAIRIVVAVCVGYYDHTIADVVHVWPGSVVVSCQRQVMAHA